MSNSDEYKKIDETIRAALNCNGQDKERALAWLGKSRDLPNQAYNGNDIVRRAIDKLKTMAVPS